VNDNFTNIYFKSFINNSINSKMLKCSLCGIEITKLDTITISSKTYKDICCFCEEKIKNNRSEKLLRLKKTIYNRKNLNKILYNTGIPLHYFEKYKDNKFSKIINQTIKEHNTVFLFGERQGTGKTTSSLVSMRHFIRKGYTPIFIRAVDLFNDLRSVYVSQNKIDITEVLKKYYDTDLLIIDDIGTEKGSEFVETQTYAILDNRVFYGKKTIVTSNLTPQKISKLYGCNLASRLLSGKTIKIDGIDFRINK